MRKEKSKKSKERKKKKDKESGKGKQINTTQSAEKKEGKNEMRDLFDTYGDAPKQKLDILFPNSEGTPVIPVNSYAVPIYNHYVKERNLSVQCNGSKCVLCEANYKISEKHLLPVYSVENGNIAILPISGQMDSKNGNPLMAQILPELGKAKEKRRLIIVKKYSNWDYEISSLPLNPEIEEEAMPVIEEFLENIDDFDFGSIYAKMSNEDLLKIPEVKRKHKAFTFTAKAATEVNLEDEFDSEDPELEGDWDSEDEDLDEDSDDEDFDDEDFEDEDFEDEDSEPDFDDMTKKELLEFAEENDLEIPNLRKMRVAKMRKAVKKAWEELD